MKVSVSLPTDDIDFLDAQVRAAGFESRSAAIHAAVSMLRASQLVDDYTAAFDDWSASGDAVLWDSAAADGLA